MLIKEEHLYDILLQYYIVGCIHIRHIILVHLRHVIIGKPLYAIVVHSLIQLFIVGWAPVRPGLQRGARRRIRQPPPLRHRWVAAVVDGDYEEVGAVVDVDNTKGDADGDYDVEDFVVDVVEDDEANGVMMSKMLIVVDDDDDDAYCEFVVVVVAAFYALE